MKYFSEVKAEAFLEKRGFEIAQRVLVKNESGIYPALRKLDGPFAMKVSGPRIVHKNKIGGIKLQVRNYSNAVKEFNNLRKIKGSTGVLFQKKVDGDEFIFGIKRTKDFGHVIVFGSGGVDVEAKSDVSFRVLPIEKQDAEEMILEVHGCKDSSKNQRKYIIENLIRLSNVVLENPEIKELDINPLMIGDGSAFVVDARILFD